MSLSTGRLGGSEAIAAAASKKKSRSGESSSSGNHRIRVCARVRPSLRYEEQDTGFSVAIKAFPHDKRVQVERPYLGNKDLRFDAALGPSSSQDQVYRAMAWPIVQDVLDGYNGTVLVYGQTGSGKTHTIGLEEDSAAEPGILPRALHDVFDRVDKDGGHTYEVQLSYMQVYMETIMDLLDTNQDSLESKFDPVSGQVEVRGLTSVHVRSAVECLQIIQEGNFNRVTAFTNMNAQSSRSHAIVQLQVTRHECMEDLKLQQELEESLNTSTNISSNGELNFESASDSNNTLQLNPPSSLVRGKLMLVDLAGSERIKKTGAVGIRASEAQLINLSLHCLGNVVHSLVDGTAHVPYRDSKLTRLLQDSLGGNSKTAIVVTVSPTAWDVQESLSALNFGQRAMKVDNVVQKHVEVDYMRLNAQLRMELELKNDTIATQKSQILNLESEISELKSRLSERSSQSKPSPNLNASVSSEAEMQGLTLAADTLQQELLTEAQEHDVTKENLQRTQEELNQLKSLFHDMKEALTNAESLRDATMQELQEFTSQFDAMVNGVAESAPHAIVEYVNGSMQDGTDSSVVDSLVKRVLGGPIDAIRSDLADAPWQHLDEPQQLILNSIFHEANQEMYVDGQADEDVLPFVGTLSECLDSIQSVSQEISRPQTPLASELQASAMFTPDDQASDMHWAFYLQSDISCADMPVFKLYRRCFDVLNRQHKLIQELLFSNKDVVSFCQRVYRMFVCHRLALEMTLGQCNALQYQIDELSKTVQELREERGQDPGPAIDEKQGANAGAVVSRQSFRRRGSITSGEMGDADDADDASSEDGEDSRVSRHVPPKKSSLSPDHSDRQLELGLAMLSSSVGSSCHGISRLSGFFIQKKSKSYKKFKAAVKG